MNEKTARAIFIFMLVAGLLFVWRYSSRRPEALPDLSYTPAPSNATAQVPCVGKHRCVLVYVAPWCPACQGTIVGIRKLIERYRDSSQIGISVIVGGDRRDKLESMAEKVGDFAFLDLDDSFAHAASIEGIPAWFVIDDKRKVVSTASGGLDANASVDDDARFLGLQ